MRHHILLPVAVLILLLPLHSAAGQDAGEGPTCQTRWRLLALGAGEDGPEPGPLLKEAAAHVVKELPLLAITVESGARYPWSVEEPLRSVPECSAAGREVLAQAEAAGAPLADYDVVFLFGDAFCAAFGYSHRTYQMADGRPVRWAWVTTDPMRYAGRVFEQRGELDVPDRAERLALRLFQASGLEHRAIVATAAHEFGHFLAPGDTDIRDGYDTPWIGHANHQPRCCMDQGFSGRRLIEVVVFGGEDLIAFCDRCRERLKMPRPPRPAWQDRLDRWLEDR